MTTITSYPDDHIIDDEIVSLLIQNGACHKGANEVRGMTVAAAIKLDPCNALVFAARFLSDEQFARAAEVEPWVALDRYVDRLSAEQFDRAAEAKPWTALAFCADRLKSRP